MEGFKLLENENGGKQTLKHMRNVHHCCKQLLHTAAANGWVSSFQEMKMEANSKLKQATNISLMDLMPSSLSRTEKTSENRFVHRDGSIGEKNLKQKI